MLEADALGHELLLERIASIPAKAEEMLCEPLSICKRTPNTHYTLTGIGSSEAHARFLAFLLNQYTPATANFLPLGCFCQPLSPNAKKSSLIIFSQGLSQNAQIALKHHCAFKETLLFTAQTTKRNILAKTVEVLPIPCNEEKGLLIRVVGPFLGFIACLQFITQQFPKMLPLCPTLQILEALKQAPAKAKQLQNQFEPKYLKQGFTLLVPPSISTFCQNLALKFIEGFFLPMPHLWDILSFAHGPFQQLKQHPAPILCLQGIASHEKELFNKAQTMIENCCSVSTTISAELPFPWNILEYEMILNHWLANNLKNERVNQKNWPGKDEDASLYAIDSL